MGGELSIGDFFVTIDIVDVRLLTPQIACTILFQSILFHARFYSSGLAVRLKLVTKQVT